LSRSPRELVPYADKTIDEIEVQERYSGFVFLRRRELEAAILAHKSRQAFKATVPKRIPKKWLRRLKAHELAIIQWYHDVICERDQDKGNNIMIPWGQYDSGKSTLVRKALALVTRIEELRPEHQWCPGTLHFHFFLLLDFPSAGGKTFYPRPMTVCT